MFKSILESRQIGPSAEQSFAIERALSSSYIEPKGTSFAGKGNLSNQAFQESLDKIYKSQGR